MILARGLRRVKPPAIGGGILFVASTLASGASISSLTVPLPAGIASSDVLLLVIAANSGSALTYTPPAGWTLVAAIVNRALFYKVATGSEPANYAVTINGVIASTFSAMIAAYRGAAYDTAGGWSLSSMLNPVAPTVTVTYANSLVVNLAVAPTSGPTYTLAGWVKDAFFINGTQQSYAFFTKQFNAGSTGTVTTTGSIGLSRSMLLVLKPT